MVARELRHLMQLPGFAMPCRACEKQEGSAFAVGLVGKFGAVDGENRHARSPKCDLAMIHARRGPCLRRDGFPSVSSLPSEAESRDNTSDIRPQGPTGRAIRDCPSR